MRHLLLSTSFQSTLPHGERRKNTGPNLLACLFQSTLPHGERLSINRTVLYKILISIHAPAWGATINFEIDAASFVFQSTLPHGERRRPPGGLTVITIFQSTLPHGERLVARIRAERKIIFQSTLPHGERLDEVLPGDSYKVFQSTLPHGERRSVNVRDVQLFLFQSTLPHGERLCDENDSISSHLGGPIPRTLFYRLLPSDRILKFPPGRLWFAPTKS